VSILCKNCYNAIVVNARDIFKEHATGLSKRLKRNVDDDRLSIYESISLLTDIIYQRDVIEGNLPITNFSRLRSIITDKDDRLNSFFDEIELGACIEEKNDIERGELNRSLSYQCYLMCWNRNKAIPLWDLNEFT